MTAQAEQDKESFKKATRAQKRRTERFEAAVEKCYAQMREKVWVLRISGFKSDLILVDECISLWFSNLSWHTGCSSGQRPFRAWLLEMPNGANERGEGQTCSSYWATEMVSLFCFTLPSPYCESFTLPIKVTRAISNAVKLQTWQWGCRKRRMTSQQPMRELCSGVKNSSLKTENLASIMQH